MTTNDDRLAEIRARVEAGHTYVADSVWLVDEVRRLRSDRDAQGRFVSVVAEFARTTAMPVSEVLEAVGIKADCDRLAAVVERVRAQVATWQAELDSGAIRDKDARYCWGLAVTEARRALEGGET